ncbi:hypothetical protein SELMODRAFT_439342 [Selaginella moellendorffii]|uniref:Uncharacterized protein n=1 Tax=Selaginella moellendorffii TaxID=88036 RepID=D8R3Q1_SELML|nr:hypothetical protein SELMODRAFT_439342 [Selaginella moellendorffii]
MFVYWSSPGTHRAKHTYLCVFFLVAASHRQSAALLVILQKFFGFPKNLNGNKQGVVRNSLAI